MKTPGWQTEQRKGPRLKHRFIVTVAIAVVWSMVALAGFTMGWVLLGAAFIGIMGTIGVEPPRRRRLPVPEPTLV